MERVKNGMLEMYRILQSQKKTNVELDKIEIRLYLGKCFMNASILGRKYLSFPIDKFSVRRLRGLYSSTVATVPTH